MAGERKVKVLCRSEGRMGVQGALLGPSGCVW